MCTGALRHGLGHGLTKRHRRAPAFLAEGHRDRSPIRPVVVRACVAGRDETALLVTEAHAVDDALGRSDFREYRGTQTAAAIGLADAIAKLAAFAELEAQ